MLTLNPFSPKTALIHVILVRKKGFHSLSSVVGSWVILTPELSFKTIMFFIFIFCFCKYNFYEILKLEYFVHGKSVVLCVCECCKDESEYERKMILRQTAAHEIHTISAGNLYLQF